MGQKLSFNYFKLDDENQIYENGLNSLQIEENIDNENL